MLKVRATIPWFAGEEAEATRDFCSACEAHFDEVFTPVVAWSRARDSSFSDAARATGSMAWRGHALAALQRASVGDWTSYERYLRRHASVCADLELPVWTWFRLSHVLEEAVRPLLIQRLVSDPARLTRALHAFGSFIERTRALLCQDSVRGGKPGRTAAVEAKPEAVAPRVDVGSVHELPAARQQTFRYSAAETVERALAELSALSASKGASSRTSGSILTTGLPNVCEHHEALRVADEKAHDLLAGQERLRALVARTQRVGEQECRRMARDIHDVVGQLLTALKLDLMWLAQRIANDTSPSSKDVLGGRCAAMIELADEALTTVRQIAVQLWPAVLDDLGIEAALAWQSGEFTRRTGIPVDLDVPTIHCPMVVDHATALFRIAQEALTNVARHASATRVTLSLETGADGATLMIRDNGRGLVEQHVSRRDALGLLGMRERATLLGGSLDLSCGAGGGMMVVARLPASRPERS